MAMRAALTHDRMSDILSRDECAAWRDWRFRILQVSCIQVGFIERGIASPLARTLHGV